MFVSVQHHLHKHNTPGSEEETASSEPTSEHQFLPQVYQSHAGKHQPLLASDSVSAERFETDSPKAYTSTSLEETLGTRSRFAAT